MLHQRPAGTQYSIGGTDYIVYTKDDGSGKWVFNCTSGESVGYATFTGRTWRTYLKKGMSDKAEVVRGERTDVPASTATLPLEYTKRVKAAHMDSISRTGLQATSDGVVFHGYSAGTPYAVRDVYLLAVWLGKDGAPGMAMQPQDGEAYINLTVRVPELFRDMYLRDIQAVLHGDDTGSGNTALSFASIPASNIYFYVTGPVVAAVQKKAKSSKLVEGMQALPALNRDIKLIAEYFMEKAKEGKEKEKDDQDDGDDDL